MAADFFPFKLRASSLGRYAIFNITARTRLAVAGARPGSPFSTLDAVLRETFASRATSTKVGLLVFRIMGLRCNTSKTESAGGHRQVCGTHTRNCERHKNRTTLSLIAAINLGRLCAACQPFYWFPLDRNLWEAILFPSFIHDNVVAHGIHTLKSVRNECRILTEAQ